MDNFVHAAAATVIAELTTLPICTTKTRFQNWYGGKGTTFTTLFRKIYKEEGIRAFYRGSRPAVTSQVISTGMKWSLYNYLNQVHWSESLTLNRMCNGVLSGLITSLIVHPFDVARVHLQMRTVQYPTDRFQWELLNRKFLYQGYSKSITKTVIGGVCFFPIFETLKPLMPEQSAFLAGTTTALISGTIIQPIDYLKTRHMFSASDLYKNFQVRDLFKGYTLNLLRVVPHYAITMSLIDYFKNNPPSNIH